MNIVIEEKVAETRYQVGDVIVLKSGTYFIHRDALTSNYYLINENMSDYANGSWETIEKMINSVKGNPYFKHYSKDLYQLKIVKK